ncbi:MAG: hypothetical protein Q9170_003773 [Blastenia crenularia]
MPGPTLVRAPLPDPAKSVIENVLELTPLTSIAPDIFTNTRELWHPPGARGVYGGAVIAQCLSAAQQSIPPPSPSNGNSVFLIHSMHCYFVLAGDSAIPIVYYVERVRDGKSFITRTVQARQKGKCIFTTTLSFVREGSAGQETINHGWDMPSDAVDKLHRALGENDSKSDTDAEALGVQTSGPFETIRLPIENNASSNIQWKKTRQWIKARGRITSTDSPQAHLSALAYMSDSYFIGTVARVHNLWRFSSSASRKDQSKTKKHEMAKMEEDENSEADEQNPRASVGMMVSLDHTIYFHRPREIKADEWLLSENESPWSGDGRGLVYQRIWNKEGVLVASCVQEYKLPLFRSNPRIHVGLGLSDPTRKEQAAPQDHNTIRSSTRQHIHTMSDSGEVEVENPSGYMVLPKDVTAEIGTIKLFNKWSYEDVEVRDISLTDYIQIRAPVYISHSAGRYAVKRFRKAQCPIIERLTNSLMMNGRNNGKKLMAVRIVAHAFEIIHIMTDQNPIQIAVDAIVNCGPREDSTRIGSAGTVRRQAVDVSPLRRVNQAIALLTIGAREAAFRNVKSVAECLAEELINAAKGSSNSYAIKKKDELERVAKSNR